MARMEIFLRRLVVCAALAISVACGSEQRSEPPPPSPPNVLRLNQNIRPDSPL